ncbi:MAG: NAD(P)/FAD-dependent oxidoreductase [Sphingobium sp.]|uniref:NAD(P)/FAD-dependent oxidoreductase n=1 Tax=Sphingobium sp. TaxID=1912891 RepID=UPI0029B97D54|nr:NAD(P)/FAD-dependent oxidoreductase [Sphingobium sp.]MDX3910704.1 NAD(P)/FAD-dependent oxidoreductase [Sphingobium sp.]
MMPTGKPKIVIVGSGFGGLAAAKALHGSAADVTLIDRTNHHLFQPLLYQVATAALSPADIATANRVLLRGSPNVRVLMAEATGVDASAREVLLADGRRLAYDYLILATGAAYSFFGNDAWRPHARVLKSLDDALAIRAALLDAFERAEQSNDPAEVRKLLTFAIVGGGPTGVEMAGTIAELARTTLARDFTYIDPRQARVVLCEAGGRLLAAFDPALSAYADEALEALGVEVRLGKAVQEIDANGLTVGDDRIDAGAVLWCAGTQARPAARWLGVEAARNGAVKVRPDCSVPGHPEVFAIGDVASYDSGSGHPLPGLAPVAKQQGAYVGRLLAARIAGRAEPSAFRYRDYGTMAVIGRSRAVAVLAGLKLKGFLAWLAWSLVHLMLMVDFRSRLSVYINWSWAWFTYGRGARLLMGEPGRAASDP